MNVKKNWSLIGVVLSGALLWGGWIQAGGIADSVKVRGGTLACGGNHFVRQGGNELHRTSYVFRNFNGYGTITLERVRVFDANGEILFDFPNQPFLGDVDVKTELGPHETAQINSADMLRENLGPAERPIQTHVTWSYVQGKPGVPLDGSSVRTVRAEESGAERSRADSECRLIRHHR